MASHCCRHGRPRTITIFEKEREILECWALFLLSNQCELEATQFAFVCPCPPPCMGKLLCCTAEATSLIVDLKYVPLCSKMAILAGYYATSLVDKEHKNVFSALKLESSSPVQ